MSKIGHYLQEHVTGEVVSSADARRYFATDGSIFTLAPALVVYPHDENDVRKVARFSWQLAERNRIIPITARGAGTDLSGAALGSGVMLAFPAHMNRIVEFDAKSGVTTVEPGTNYGKLQQTLMTHGRYLPPYPASYEYSTIGGAVANNASGERSFKYGSTRGFVRSLRVVLANGEVITTGRLGKRELSKKLGLTTFEGEIYRSLDTLIEENYDLIHNHKLHVTKNTAGYDLAGIKNRDGSFDLTPLIVGSQGTLGIITEISLDTDPYSPESTLCMAGFDGLAKAQSAIKDLRAMSDTPCAIEMVDAHALELAHAINPNQLKTILPRPYPRLTLLVELDGSEKHQKRVAKRVRRILDQHAVSVQSETDPDKQSRLWKIRHASAILTAHAEGQARAVPVIDDAVVPIDTFAEFVTAVTELCSRNSVPAAIWGHAGDAIVHMMPYLDLAQVGHRQTAFRLMDEYYKLVIGLGGSTSGEHGDGRLRAPYLPQLYGEKLYEIMAKVKQIFDPYNTMNPGVKIGVTQEDIKPLVRSEYSLQHLYDHLPRS